MRFDRRSFLTTCAAGTLCLDLGGCTSPGRREGGVLWLERVLLETPRAELPTVLWRSLSDGMELRDLASALMGAALFGVVPRARLGPDQHALLVVHSAYEASQALPARDAPLPLLWAADFFRQALESARTYEPEPLQRLPHRALPPPATAPGELAKGMESGDGDRTASALVALWRGGRRREMEELLALYGERDFRHIGHKAIFIANGLRVAESAGLENREQLVQSIGLALALRYEDSQGADFDSAWHRNRERAARLRAVPTARRSSASATRALLTALRQGDQDAAGQAFYEHLRDGLDPSSSWDAVRCHAVDLHMNRPDNIVALHAVTTANASYANYCRARSTHDRRLILLQAASRAAFFRSYATRRALEASKRHTEVPLEALSAEIVTDIAEVLDAPRDDPPVTARRALGLLQHPGGEAKLVREIRRLTAYKAIGNHDFKLTEAFLEDTGLMSEPWRSRYLACALGGCRGASDPVGEVQERIAAAQREANASTESGCAGSGA